MKKILSSAIATLAALSFTTAAFPADATKPVVPAGPVYATAPGGEVQNEAYKAAKARKTTDTKDAKERAKTDARDAKIKAGQKASKAKAKAKADAAAAKDASSAPK
jgi:hypothetical protein